MRLVVVHVLLVLAGCGRGVNEQGLLAGRAPTPAPGPEAATAPPDAGLEAEAPPPDAAGLEAAAEIFPTCAAIGFGDQVLMDCEEPPPYPGAGARRTPDQRYSCARCSARIGSTIGQPIGQSCAAAPRGPGLPWLCVSSCAICPFFDCRDVVEGSPCKLAGFADAGAP